ncbi:MAG: choice-of-anchor Q domain-containing protein [Verrucomicrobiota bacterium]
MQIANAQAAHEGTYVLLVTNRFGSARTEPAIVRVQEGSDFLVTSLADDGVGTLRDAMRGASSIAGGRITFSNVFGKIHLQAPLPEIKSDLSVIGPGPDQVQVSGADLFSVFKVVAGNVLISGLTITEGFGATGGGVVNSANLTLSNCVIAANSAIGPGGGGIANSGNLKVISSLVLSNSASGVDVPTYSMGSDVPTSAFGGGIHHSGSGLLISNSIIAGNAVRGGNGGGVEGVGYFQGAPSYGGGISIHGGTVHLVSSTIHANAAFGGLGGHGGTSSGGHGAEAAGGGLWISDGWIDITNCTFSMNLAKGGNGGYGLIWGGLGGSANGGGIAQSSGGGVVINCTIANNQTEGGADGRNRNGWGGGFAFSSGGGLLGGSNFTFRNTIVAGNFPNDVAAQMNSGGHNLIGNSRNLTGLHSTDLTNVNARLGSLQPNGRFTPTHLPLPGSPAIDAGSQFGAPPWDQRGVRRPVGKGVDIGACEYEPITLTAKSAAGSLILLIQGPIDYRYGIERSANLLDWTLAATLDGGSGGLEWRESSAFDQSVRFYRAVVVGP